MELSVFCTSQFVIDKRVWNAYLSGLTVQQTISHILKTMTSHQEQVGAAVTTQYRNFEMLEEFLHHPKQLSTQLIFSLTPVTKQVLIHSYYRLDSRVTRELLGKKLTHRVRKELDDIATKTRTSVLGCRRMFDNLKRITKRVEDASADIVAAIMSHFLLARELAAQYAHIIFINTHRLDTTKRKLMQVKSTDFEYSMNI
jgi:methyl-accepting chemotaxis protein